MYIEHTDAYQVVYHANYFKFLRRGREAALFGHRARDDDHHHHSADAPLAPDLLPPSCATVLVVAVDDVVFARSATLGDDLIVRTRFLGAGERTLTLRQEVLHAADETLMLAATVVVAPADAAGAPLGVGVGARDAARDPADDPADDPAWLARSNGVCVYSDSHVDSDSLIPCDASPSATAEVTLFESELSLGTGATDADVLRWFERGRTDAIGGADALAELKENGIVVVVSKMNRGRFAPAVAGGGAPGWHPDERRAREPKPTTFARLRPRNPPRMLAVGVFVSGVNGWVARWFTRPWNFVVAGFRLCSCSVCWREGGTGRGGRRRRRRR